MSGVSRTSTSLLAGVGTLFLSYIVLIGIGMVRFSYFGGPVPDLFYAIPVPALLGLTAGIIAFKIKSSG
jgi:hypothetical protein